MVYRTLSPISEEYDQVTGFVSDLRELKRSGVDLDEESEETKWWMWDGCVRHPESRERSSLRREAERLRKEIRERD